jgi:hypothetical protein
MIVTLPGAYLTLSAPLMTLVVEAAGIPPPMEPLMMASVVVVGPEAVLVESRVEAWVRVRPVAVKSEML